MHTSSALRSFASNVLVPPFRTVVRYGPAKQILWNAFKKLSWQPHTFEARSRFGFKFAGNTNDLVSRDIYFFGIWEPAISQWVSCLPLAGRTVIDIGGHLGWYSLLASQLVGPKGRVVSIEASPVNFKGLQHNVAINEFTNIRLVNSAAWDSVCELDLHFPSKSGTGMGTVVDSFMNAHSQKSSVEYDTTVKVKAAPASSLIDSVEAKSAALVKIDVEGAEPQALAGLAASFDLFPDDVRILTEYSPEAFGIDASIYLTEHLTRRGFQAYVIPNPYSSDYYLAGVPNVELTPVESLSSLNRQTDLVFSRQPL